MTVAWGVLSTASRSSAARARSSCTVPMTELATITPANNMSGLIPSAMTISTNSTPTMPLTGVSRLARRIWPVVRVGSLGTVLTRPSATRAATSAAVSPRADQSAFTSGAMTDIGTTLPPDRPAALPMAAR
jgi:hypothetical protein